MGLWLDRGLAVPWHQTVAVLHGAGRVSRFDTAIGEPAPGFAALVRANKVYNLFNCRTESPVKHPATPNRHRACRGTGLGRKEIQL